MATVETSVQASSHAVAKGTFTMLTVYFLI